MTGDERQGIAEVRAAIRELTVRVEEKGRQSEQSHAEIKAELHRLREQRDDHADRLTKLEEFRKHAGAVLGLVKVNEKGRIEHDAIDRERFRASGMTRSSIALMAAVIGAVVALVQVAGRVWGWF